MNISFKAHSLLISLTLAVLMFSCSGGSKSSTSQTDSITVAAEKEAARTSSSDADGVGADNQNEASTITRTTLPIKDEFQYITSMSSFDIQFEYADESRIDVECDERFLPFIQAEVECKILTISLANEKSVETNKFASTKSVKAYIYSKNLEWVTLYGSGSFRASSLHGENLTLATGGKGDILVDTVQAKTLKIENMGRALCDIKHIEATEAMISAYKDGTIRAGVDIQNIDVLASGESSVSFTGKIQHHSVTSSPRSSVTLNGRVLK